MLQHGLHTTSSNNNINSSSSTTISLDKVNSHHSRLPSNRSSQRRNNSKDSHHKGSPSKADNLNHLSTHRLVNQTTVQHGLSITVSKECTTMRRPSCNRQRVRAAASKPAVPRKAGHLVVTDSRLLIMQQQLNADVEAVPSLCCVR
jgi:hypothetical protein